MDRARAAQRRPGAWRGLVERSYAAGRAKPHGKTARSRRRVPLTDRALAALDMLPPRLGTRLLFPSPKGGYHDLHNWRTRDWYPALEAAGVTKRGPYALRHTYATWALRAGLGTFELARYMGTSVEMIDRTYGHLAAGSEERARTLLGAYTAESIAKPRPRLRRRVDEPLHGVGMQPVPCEARVQVGDGNR